MESADDIFLHARELADPAQRNAYLAQACGADANLRADVEAMLRDAAGAEEYFGAAAASRPPVAPSPPLEGPGTWIGRYKLLERIGEGGMGVVYMAEQREPVLRKVALKIIKAGMDTQQVIARFEAERQALALMDHPNIAKVWDGGATDPHPTFGHPLPSDGRGAGGEGPSRKAAPSQPSTTHSQLSSGRPYFVMELVQGVAITQFCDQNELALGDRLKLFINVCQAVQHAHQKGIIHRDLKPSNVLVTMNDGVAHPMVIDFGVAKAIDQTLTEKTLFTNFGTLIGTPAYMSPEQAEMSKLDVDTRADIYSLGVLLYELLTGTTPFAEERLRSVAYGEMQRILLEEEPERPSTRLKKKHAIAPSPVLRTPSPPVGERDGVRGTRDIDSDVDWIVMKCLEKDRNRRFETASNLAADLTRFLNGEPVVARPPSSAYRLQKMVRRNKLQFAAAAFILLVLVVAVVVSRWQAVRATRAEQQARQQTQVAERESRQAEAVKNFLLENLMGVDLYGESPDPDPVAMESTKALLARVALRMEGKFVDQPLMEAEIRMTLAEGFSAVYNYRAGAPEAEKALAIRQQLLGPTDSNTLSSAALAAHLKNGLGQRQAAEQLLSDYIKLLRQSPQGLPAGGEVVLATYGIVLRFNGRAAEGIPYLREALEVSAQTLGPKPPHHRRSYWQGFLAYAYQDAGNWKEAEALYRSIIQQRQRDGPEYHLIAPHEFGLARLLVRQTNTNRSKEALPLLERVVSYARQRMGRDDYDTLQSEYFLGQACEQQGDVDRAVELYTDVYQRFIKKLPNASAIELSADIARFFIRHQHFHEARAIFEALRETYDAIPEAGTNYWNTHVQATAATKGWPAAAEVCGKYLDKSAANAASMRSQSSILLYSGDNAGYQQAVTKALALVPAMTNLDEQRRIAEMAGLGPIVFAAHQLKQCEALLGFLERGLATAATNQSSWHRTIGALQLRRAQFDDSLAHLEKALANLRPGSESARVLALKTLTLHYLHRGDEARGALEQAETLMKPRLLDHLSEREGFLTHDERTYLIYRREAQGLLGLK